MLQSTSLFLEADGNAEATVAAADLKPGARLLTYASWPIGLIPYVVATRFTPLRLGCRRRASL